MRLFLSPTSCNALSKIAHFLTQKPQSPNSREAWTALRIYSRVELRPPRSARGPRRNARSEHQHDTLAVTDCSRNGKGALIAGAFDESIVLTIPQESGSGGDTYWRLSDAEQAEGYVVQTSGEIVRENVWFALVFNVFAQHNTSWLPFDHHMLAGLIAPRALLAIENTEVVWLSPQSIYGYMTAAHKIWEALGIADHMGVTQAGNHSHCAFPAEQQPELTAYFERFLLDCQADTTVFKTTNETVQ